MKKVLYTLFLACGVLSSCGGGMTLGEIDKLSPSERSVIQELKITSIEGDGKLNLRETLQGFKSLKKLEITKSFKGSLEGNSHEEAPELETLTAKGATIIGWGLFNHSENIKNVNLPNVKQLENHAFGGWPSRGYMNKIETLDFPQLRIIGGNALGGCAQLKVLKFGSPERITCYLNIFGDIPEVAEQIDLYLGEYEYTHNVKGNQWTIHSEPNQDLISFENTAETGEVGIQHAGTEGIALGTLTFKNIYPY